MHVDWPTNESDTNVCRVLSNLIKFSGLSSGMFFQQIMSAIMEKAINIGKPHIGEIIAKGLQSEQEDALCVQPANTFSPGDKQNER